MIGWTEAVGELITSPVNGVVTAFSIALAIRDSELAQARLLVSSTVEPAVADVSTWAAGWAVAAPAPSLAVLALSEPSLVVFDTDAQKR